MLVFSSVDPSHLHFRCDDSSEFLALISNLLSANYLMKSVFLTESVENALIFFVSILQ